LIGEADSGIDGEGFRARAGALTLLFVAGSPDREVLLGMLESARDGGLLGPILDQDELEGYEEVAEEGEGGPDEDYAEDELDETIGPHTQMRTSAKGEQFLFVAFAMERWLRNCPGGPRELGPAGAEAIAPLACCWSAGITHALAERPLTLAELDAATATLDREVVEEHIEALGRTGQVEAVRDDGATRYALTDWGQEGIAPVIAAVRYERHYPEDDVLPPDILDVEAAFELVLPLLKLPADLSGTCRLGVQIPGGEPLMAGATVHVDEGRVASSSPLLEQVPENWATGSPLDWMDTVVDPAAGRIKTGGDTRLANALLQALHETLFGVPVR
jgi:DNA-binding transcriptional ArsR family regulator